MSLRSWFCLIFLSVTISAFATPQLTNYLGTGSNPKLHLELSKNGPDWAPFNIDYQQTGGIPWSANPSIDWSSWNVKDEKNNYYGTITLHSNANTASFEKYSGEHLEGINFTFNGQTYQLTVNKIIPFPSDSPFPDAPLATPAKQADGKPCFLTVTKDKILDPKGKPIKLKGITRPSLEWNAKGEHLNKEDIQKMAQWGSNVIRLDLNQDYWFHSGPKTEKGSYKQIIDAIIYYATLNKMAVILDLHWVNDSEKQTKMANKKSVDFWKQVSEEYKNFGTVIFELYNEPSLITPKVWLEGDEQYAGHQALYDAVRSTGAKNLVIINGLDWGYDLNSVSDHLVKGVNIIYGSHPYNTKGEPNWPISSGGDFQTNFKNFIGKYPIIWTEFGVNLASYFPSGYQEKYANMLKEIDKDSIHYTGFAWWVDENNPAFPTIIKDWQGTAINGGVMIRHDMEMNPPDKLDIH